MNRERQVYKVISPVPRKDGSIYWMRIGSAFPNKDASINLYLDALPTNPKLQLRQMSEEELAERAGRRASRLAAPPTSDSSQSDPMPF